MRLGRWLPAFREALQFASRRVRSQYPRGMDEKRPPATDSQHSQQDATADPEATREPERYGIVTIERRVKDDGRALLLYTRNPQGPG
jgi:hypothetical protein